jgi:hypothetical protein
MRRTASGNSLKPPLDDGQAHRSRSYSPTLRGSLDSQGSGSQFKLKDAIIVIKKSRKHTKPNVPSSLLRPTASSGKKMLDPYLNPPGSP